MKCDNISTKAQMEALADNIRNFQRIEDEYGSIDSFITEESIDIVVQKLLKGSSPYKMKITIARHPISQHQRNQYSAR